MGFWRVFVKTANGGVPQGSIISVLHFADLRDMAMVC